VRRLGVVALCVVAVAGCGLAFLATSDPKELVPYGLGGSWLGGVLTGAGPALTPTLFTVLMLTMLLAYAGAVALADGLPVGWVLGVAALLDLAFVLAPPLLSGDVVGYVIYAHLGAAHGIDPYLHGTALTPTDPLHRFVKWRSLPSDYGPPFTLATYALGGVGLTAGIWVLKATAGLCAFGSNLLVRARSGRRGARPLVALALNPLLLVYGIGGAHNDLITMLIVTAGIAAMVSRRAGAGAVAAVAAASVKLSGALMLPFAWAAPGDRRRFVVAAVATGAVVVGISALAFGHGLVGYADALHRLAQRASSESVPGWLGRQLGLFGGSGVTPSSRLAFELLFLAAAGWQLSRAWRGEDWVLCAGWAAVALILTTSWLLPWYIVWLLPFAALAHDNRLHAATVALTGWIVVVHLPQLGLA
jgi:Glycosyltransferase family 87